MIRIPNPEEGTDTVFVTPYGIELIGEVSQEQIKEIKTNQLKILKLLIKKRNEIRAFRRQNK